METRIRRNIIILIVVTFLVLIGMSAGWFFVLVRPQREEIAKTKTQYEDLKTKAAKLPDALKARQQAQDKLNYLKGQLAFFAAAKPTAWRRAYTDACTSGEIEGDTPVAKAARDVAWRSWMNEYHYQFGPALQQELKNAEAAAKVTVLMPPVKVDDPPQTPEAIKIPNNGFLKPLSATNNGAIALQVNGSFQNILRFLQTINHSNILMVVGNLKLEGYSPTIKATFTITPYLVAAGPGAKLTATSGGGGESGGESDGRPGDGTPRSPSGEGGDADAAPAGKKADKESITVMAKIKNPRHQPGF